MSEDHNNAVLEALRLRERTLELEAVDVRGRIAEIRDLIAKLENGPRKRPRKITVINMPDRVRGASHTHDDTDNDPDNGPEDTAA